MIRLAAILLAIAAPAAAQVPHAPVEIVRFASNDAARTELTGYLYRPQTPGRHPAIVALHGCSGLFDRGMEMGVRHQEWADRLVAQGYVVLFPDSFNPRGFRTVCTTRDRPAEPWRERPRDAYGALLWLRTQPFVRANRVALLGFSHGGSTVLATIDAARDRRGPGDVRPDFVTAIAFYPGCTFAANGAWRPRMPLLLLIGAADNWTPAAPCERLRGRGFTDVVVYPGAVHAFDHPHLPLTERRGLAYTADNSGRAMIGTDPAARADAIARVDAALARALRP